MQLLQDIYAFQMQQNVLSDFWLSEELLVDSLPEK